MATLEELNRMPAEQVETEFARCCGSARWIVRMDTLRPFADTEALYTAAQQVWEQLDPVDWLEAFTHHPRIGDREALRARFAETREWAAGEQAGAAAASDEVLDALAEGNRMYEERFGHIFIVCATGKTAQEMLELLMARIDNDAATELRMAAAEQAKITRIRLEKLLQP